MIPLSKLFDIKYGHSLELNRLKLLSRSAGGIPFVSRKMGDNGISAYVAMIPSEVPTSAGTLSCALGGNGVLSTFLQEVPYYSGRDIAILTPLIKLTRQQLLYYSACIAANRYRYSYGRQANRSLKNILLPPVSAIPSYVANVDVARFDGSSDSARNESIMHLDVENWRYFHLSDLFDIKKGKRLTKANMRHGRTLYIGASDSSNGVTAKIGQLPNHKAGAITVSYNGSVAEAFYQPEDFWATDDVNVLYPRQALTPGAALFLCTILRLEKYRYNFGRKWHLERMLGTKLKLPSTAAGRPDLLYMDSYIQTLPFSSRINERKAQ